MADIKYLDYKEVAQVLGLKPDTVLGWGKKGILSSVQIPRNKGFGMRMIRGYPEHEVLELLDKISHELDIDDAFGNYFAGLVDGEGTFILNSNTYKTHKVKDGTYKPYTFNSAYLKIGMRNDELPLLIYIREKLGFGMLSAERIQKSIHNANPSATFQVVRHSDNLRIVELLDRYPLHGKKARDYAIWREFVLERSKPDPRQERLEQLAQDIRAVKVYAPPSQSDIDSVKPLNKDASVQIRGHKLGRMHLNAVHK